MPPGGLPDAFLEARTDDAAAAARPRASRKGRGPFTTAQANERFGRDVEPHAARSSSARSSSSAASCARAAPSASGATRTCCGGCAARRSLRCAREVEPAEQAALGALPAELARDRPPRDAARGARPAAGARAAGGALGVRGAAAPRAATTSREQLDQLCAIGRGRLGRRRARPRRASTSARTPRVLGRAGGAPRARERGRARRDPRGARATARSSGSTSLAATGLERGEALPALWDLVWAGEVTNDAWTPLRAGRRYGAPRPQRARRAASRAQRANAITATQGRWSLDRQALRRARPTAARSPSCCSSGRGSSRATASAPRGSPAATAPSTGSCARSRRSGSAAAATSSRASAARSSRSAAPSSACASCGRATDDEPEPLVLAAADPAQPYGAALPWPKRAGGARRARRRRVRRAARRRAGALRRARRQSLVPLREPEEEWLRAGARGARRARARARRASGSRSSASTASRWRDRRHAAPRRGRLPRRARAAPSCAREGAGALAAVVLLAGCGADPPEQVGAERAVARQANAESAECTSRSRILFREGPPANVFICAVKVGDGFCDVYRVDRKA